MQPQHDCPVAAGDAGIHAALPCRYRHFLHPWPIMVVKVHAVLHATADICLYYLYAVLDGDAP
jgi:hypothetical protein